MKITGWLWLLAVPWIVWDSTYTFNCKPIDGTPYFSCPTEHMYYLAYKGDKYSNMDLHFTDKDEAQDMAEALNQAHERRSSKWLVLPDDVVKRSSYTFGLYDNMVPVGAYRKK